MKELIMMYFSEAKWLHEGFIPKIEEYEGVALGSSGILTIATASFVDMGDIATKEAFEWLIKKPKIVIAGQKIGRLMDDIAGHEVRVRDNIPHHINWLRVDINLIFSYKFIITNLHVLMMMEAG